MACGVRAADLSESRGQIYAPNGERRRPKLVLAACRGPAEAPWRPPRCTAGTPPPQLRRLRGYRDRSRPIKRLPAARRRPAPPAAAASRRGALRQARRLEGKLRQTPPPACGSPDCRRGRPSEKVLHPFHPGIVQAGEFHRQVSENTAGRRPLVCSFSPRIPGIGTAWRRKSQPPTSRCGYGPRGDPGANVDLAERPAVKVCASAENGRQARQDTIVGAPHPPTLVSVRGTVARRKAFLRATVPRTETSAPRCRAPTIVSWRPSRPFSALAHSTTAGRSAMSTFAPGSPRGPQPQRLVGGWLFLRPAVPKMPGTAAPPSARVTSNGLVR